MKLTTVARQTEAAANAQRVRDDYIRKAHASGHSIRAVAEATGLSRARIHQIIHGR